MPEDLKVSQIGSSPMPPPFRGLHSPGVRKHCQIIFDCYFGNRQEPTNKTVLFASPLPALTRSLQIGTSSEFLHLMPGISKTAPVIAVWDNSLWWHHTGSHLGTVARSDSEWVEAYIILSWLLADTMLNAYALSFKTDGPVFSSSGFNLFIGRTLSRRSAGPKDRNEVESRHAAAFWLL